MTRIYTSVDNADANTRAGALYAADLVIVPCECKFLAADSVASTISTIEANIRMGWRGSLLGILPTFYRERNNESTQTYADLCEL